jgi:hypothetical protein
LVALLKKIPEAEKGLAHHAQLVGKASCTLAPCQAHNLEVVGSNPTPATNPETMRGINASGHGSGF